MWGPLNRLMGRGDLDMRWVPDARTRQGGSPVAGGRMGGRRGARGGGSCRPWPRPLAWTQETGGSGRGGGPARTGGHVGGVAGAVPVDAGGAERGVVQIGRGA